MDKEKAVRDATVFIGKALKREGYGSKQKADTLQKADVAFPVQYF